MRKFFGSLVFLILLSTQSTVRADFTAQATLSGDNERPTPHPGLPSFGFASVLFEAGPNQLDVMVTFSNLAAPASAGHIHVGSADVAGPVILPFASFPAAISGSYSRVLTAADLLPSPANGINTFADAINAIFAGNTYVNIHNSVFPGGEIRGQLGVVPEPTSLLLGGIGAVGLLGYAWRRRRLLA